MHTGSWPKGKDPLFTDWLSHFRDTDGLRFSQSLEFWLLLRRIPLGLISVLHRSATSSRRNRSLLLGLATSQLHLQPRGSKLSPQFLFSFRVLIGKMSTFVSCPSEVLQPLPIAKFQSHFPIVRHLLKQPPTFC